MGGGIFWVVFIFLLMFREVVVWGVLGGLVEGWVGKELGRRCIISLRERVCGKDCGDNDSGRVAGEEEGFVFWEYSEKRL